MYGIFSLSVVIIRYGGVFLNNAHLLADYLVVGSDSGRIVILEYIPQKNIFNKVCRIVAFMLSCSMLWPGGDMQLACTLATCTCS